MSAEDMQKLILSKVGTRRLRRIQVWKASEKSDTYHVRCTRTDLSLLRSIVRELIKQADTGELYDSITVDEFTSSHQSFCFTLIGAAA